MPENYRHLTHEEIKLLEAALDCLQSHRFQQCPSLDCSGTRNPDIKAMRKALARCQVLI